MEHCRASDLASSAFLLDDMLKPSQAKLIGPRSPRAEQAREQMERHQAGDAPTPADDSVGDRARRHRPNTIAEYLDNEVTPETATEVEQICLGRTSISAEVAACHQILTAGSWRTRVVPPTAGSACMARQGP